MHDQTGEHDVPGEHERSVTSRFECDEHRVLGFAEAPVEFIRPLENATVTEGQPLRLSCTLSKDNCQVTWLKDNEEINLTDEEKSRFVASNDGRVYRLEVKESKMLDAGSYTIKVEDKEQSCQVVVTGKTNAFEIERFLRRRCSRLQKRPSTSSFH